MKLVSRDHKIKTLISHKKSHQTEHKTPKICTYKYFNLC